MNLEIFCFECPRCRNGGEGRYPLAIRQQRGDWLTICKFCRAVVQSFFNGEMWLSQITKELSWIEQVQ